MDKVDLNNAPDLSMEEITKQLFNNDFISDIQFIVEGKVLYAHTWELSKRSTVFREQFRGTWGDNKLITIDDTTYEVFYQFLRFIYTDKCDIEQESICEMLKLALKYKILKLENTVLNLGKDIDTRLALFEFSLVNKYELCCNYLFDAIIREMNNVVRTDTFLKIKTNVLEKILTSNRMPAEMSEIKLFNNLARWMSKSCELNQTPITQRRSHFDQLLRLIRFPVMSGDEFNECVENHPDLFTSDDISTICIQIIRKGKDKNTSWLAEPRLEYVQSTIIENSAQIPKWITKFTVSANLILFGLRYRSRFSNYEIHVSGTDRTTNDATVSLKFNFEDSATPWNIISLGETIKLKPNVDYTLELKYINAETGNFLCRGPNTDCIITGPSDLITLTETSKNLFEIILKIPSTN